jgi:hypothetical protein
VDSKAARAFALIAIFAALAVAFALYWRSIIFISMVLLYNAVHALRRLFG